MPFRPHLIPFRSNFRTRAKKSKLGYSPSSQLLQSPAFSPQLPKSLLIVSIAILAGILLVPAAIVAGISLYGSTSQPQASEPIIEGSSNWTRQMLVDKRNYSGTFADRTADALY